MKRSIRTQLTVSMTLVVLLTVLLISVLSNLLINKMFRDYIANQQQVKTSEIVSDLSLHYDRDNDDWNTDFIHTIGMYALYDGYIIKVYEPDGTPVWDAEQHDMNLCTQVMADISGRMQKKYPRMNGEFMSEDFVLRQNDQDIGIVSINYYGPYFLSESDFQFLGTLNSVLLGAGAAALLLAFAVGWFVARKISRPIVRAAAVTNDIAGGSYDIRFEEDAATRELHSLVLSVNHLAGKLKEQEGIRRQMTADVAHELRTPLTTVGTHLEMMMEGIWEPTGERLKSCHDEINRISKLVRDLESLAAVEHENFKVVKEQMDIQETISSCVQGFAAELEKKQIRVEVRGDVSNLYADRDRMHQVMNNLISNAVKYTSKGGSIQISLRETPEDIVIEVNDNGRGIPAEELPYIFERFYRADKSRNRKTGGAGIGLAVVKSIVLAHGGNISVGSEPDQGSTFVVTLPKKG